MAVTDDQFRNHVSKDGGLTIARDPRTRSRLLKVAAERLALKRADTELADHLSDDVGCQRRGVLKRRAMLARVAAGKPATEEPDAQSVIWFAFGHSLQDTMLGPSSEKPIWSEEHGLWYSPDGMELLKDGDLYEIKSTRMSPLKKADREAGLSVEDVLASNPATQNWWKYIMGVMYLEGSNEYYLGVAWIIPAEFEVFHVQVTREKRNENWADLTERRMLRRGCLDSGTLPGCETRTFQRQCDFCPYLGQEPCATDVPVINVRERVAAKAGSV